MHALTTVLEDLWVVITFAEYGEYQSAKNILIEQPQCSDLTSIQAA